MPVARNCWVAPAGTEASTGSTASDTSAGGVTCMNALPPSAPLVAETVAVPTPTPVASPLASTVARPGSLLDQVTLDVRSAVEPSV